MSKPVSDVSIKLISELHDALRGVKADLEAAKLREAELQEENNKAHFHLDNACDTYTREESAQHKDSGFGVLAYRIHNAIKSEAVRNQADFLKVIQERDAAMSALAIVRRRLHASTAELRDMIGDDEVLVVSGYAALAKTDDPSAALAELRIKHLNEARQIIEYGGFDALLDAIGREPD